MFNEKLNIKCSNKTYILVDESKIVNTRKQISSTSRVYSKGYKFGKRRDI